MSKREDKYEEEKTKELKDYIKAMAKTDKEKSILRYAMKMRINLSEEYKEADIDSKDLIEKTLNRLDVIIDEFDGEHPKKILVSLDGPRKKTELINRYSKEFINKHSDKYAVVNMPKEYSDFTICLEETEYGSGLLREVVIAVVDGKIKKLYPKEN